MFSVDLLHDALSPMFTSAITWLVAMSLGVLLAYIKKNAQESRATQLAVKALMRSDLVRRYKECRDSKTGCWMRDATKDEWLQDYSTYHSLAGENGYLDAMKEKVIEMPTCPIEQGK